MRRFPALLTSITLLAGCGGGTTVSPPPPPPPPVAATVSVTPPTASLTTLGQTVQLVATVRDAAGNPIVGAAVSWISAAPSVATVSNGGLVTAAGSGSTIVTATSGAVTGTAAVTVQLPVAALVITAGPASGVATAGLSTLLVALRDATGALVPTATNEVTVSLTAGTNDGTLAGVTTAAAVAGVASFPGLAISRPGAGYRLQASAIGLPPVTGPAFDVAIRFQTLDAGRAHTCGLDVSNTLWCWGANGAGQLGQGDLVERPKPTRVGAAGAWRAFGAGADNGCAVTQPPRVAHCWGASAGVTTPTPVAGAPQLIVIRAAAHTCGALAAGTGLSCWGPNPSGQLGRGTTTAVEPTPGAVLQPPNLINVYLGAAFSCGLDDAFVGPASSAFCWGSGVEGELGNGAAASSATPVAVIGGYRYVTLAAADGGSSACGLQADGIAYCWGRNAEGQLGNNGVAQANAPIVPSGGLRFAEIALGARHGCGVALTGTVYCWGRNTAGELGLPAGPNVLVPIAATGAAGLTKLTAGETHSCGLAADGRAFCWGGNDVGQLGVVGPSRSTAVQVATP